MNGIFKIVSILFLVVNFQACASSNNPGDGSEELHAVLISGFFVYGHEVNAIQPCGSKRSYWVVGSDSILNSMTHKYKTLTEKPYEKVFMQFTGEYLGKATDGFAADYDGQLLVKKIIMITKSKGDSCDPENITKP